MIIYTYLNLRVNIEQLNLEENDNSTTKESAQFSLLQDFWVKVLNEEISIITYGVLIITVVILLTLQSLLFFRYCIQASIRLHNDMFSTVVNATMRFYNINPSGRILNRFAQDVNQVDEYLPTVLSQCLQVGYYLSLNWTPFFL